MGRCLHLRSRSVHSIVASTDPANQGFAALEALFHEATQGMVGDQSGTLASEIAQQCKGAGIEVPDNLVHVIIFFTAGELTRQAYGEAGVTYQPYAQKNGLYVRACWTRYVSALDLFWKPHIEGRISLDQAVEKMVRVLAENL